jgi:hypothetical protein
MRCRPGDLAVVVRARVKSNIGRIVRVMKTDDGSSGVPLDGVGPAWLVKSSARLTWWFGTCRRRRRYGPLLDADLQPIRGISRSSMVLSTSINDRGVIINLTDPVSGLRRHRPNPLG